MTGESEVPKGSVAVGTVVRLPADAEPPFTVFINGVEQREGGDYRIRGREIVFNRSILKEKVGAGRWLAMFLGLFGTYRKHETVDVQYTRAGKAQLISDAAVHEDRPPDPHSGRSH
jgi:hypothetical protein